MSLVSVSDYERRASKILPKSPWDYYQSGAEKQLTLELNKAAYDRYSKIFLHSMHLFFSLKIMSLYPVCASVHVC